MTVNLNRFFNIFNQLSRRHPQNHSYVDLCFPVKFQLGISFISVSENSSGYQIPGNRMFTNSNIHVPQQKTYTLKLLCHLVSAWSCSSCTVYWSSTFLRYHIPRNKIDYNFSTAYWLDRGSVEHMYVKSAKWCYNFFQETLKDTNMFFLRLDSHSVSGKTLKTSKLKVFNIFTTTI